MNARRLHEVFHKDAVKGRVVLVTGGGSGIGQEIAIQLAQFGAKVTVMGRRQDKLESTISAIQEQNQATYFCGDVRKSSDAEAAVAHTIKKFGKLNAVVNAAAGNFLALAERLSVNAFKTVMDIDVVGTFNICHAAFPALKQSKDACIVNISATLHQPATWYQCHASAAKAAVDSLTRSLALEWGQFGIKVTGIAPGPILDTVGTEKLAGATSVEDIIKWIPVNRGGHKCDIAAMVVYLFSPLGSFVSGDTIVVDGGNMLYKPPVMDYKTVEMWSKATEKRKQNSKL